MNSSWKPIHSLILLLVVLFAVALGFDAILLGRFDAESGITAYIVTETVILILLAILLSVPIVIGFKRGSKSMMIFFSAGFLVIMFVATLIGISALENIKLEKDAESREWHPIETHNHAIDDVLSEIS